MLTGTVLTSWDVHWKKIDSIFVCMYSLSVLRVSITERHSIVRIVASEEEPNKQPDITDTNEKHVFKFTTCSNDLNLDWWKCYIPITLSSDIKYAISLVWRSSTVFLMQSHPQI